MLFFWSRLYFCSLWGFVLWGFWPSRLSSLALCHRHLAGGRPVSKVPLQYSSETSSTVSEKVFSEPPASCALQQSYCVHTGLAEIGICSIMIVRCSCGSKEHELCSGHGFSCPPAAPWLFAFAFRPIGSLLISSGFAGGPSCLRLLARTFHTSAGDFGRPDFHLWHCAIGIWPGGDQSPKFPFSTRLRPAAR